MKHLQCMVYNPTSLKMELFAKHSSIDVFALYIDNEVIDFYDKTDPFHHKKINLLERYETDRNNLRENQICEYVIGNSDEEESEEDSDNERERKKINIREINKSAGIIPCPHGQRIRGTLRSCVHDAFINAAIQFDIYVNKKNLYKNVPIREDTNGDLQAVQRCETIKKTGLKFKYCDVRGKKGGHVEFLRELKDGVYICLAKVEASDGSNVEEHCFVWNAKYYDKGTKEFYPAIIDNWDKVPIQLLQEEDVKSLKNLYKALTKIFDGNCMVHYILMVKK